MATLARAQPADVNAFLEMVSRSCKRRKYNKSKVPVFQTRGQIVAYSSPDSTYAVTKKFLDEAKASILIGIYDFTAQYMKELLIKAMRRGVRVSLMLDLDGRTGETDLFNELVKYGCEGVPAPSCANKEVSYFASSHEKVIVVDGEWTLVQSGNWTDNSIPQNESDGGDPRQFVPGNRDMGIAIKSEPLASYFTRILRSDIKLEQAGAHIEGLPPGLAELQEIDLLEAAPKALPIKLFPSKRFNPAKDLKVVPVLTPDNYVDVIPSWLATARKSIFIEEQYIRGGQTEIGAILAGIAKTMKANPGLDVRIILARPFPGKRFDKEAAEIRQLGPKFGLKLGANVRILNPKRFVHCHNKLIIVDGQSVLVSSQNWSDTAVLTNREAGLLLFYPEVARYFAAIFDGDWTSGLKTLPKKTNGIFFAPESLGTGKTVRLAWGDYEEV